MFAASPFSLLSVLIAVGAVTAFYALHHLRITPTRQVVATVMFWREAARAQKARSLWSPRFTHRRTFLLLSLIALILAAALSADRWGTGTSEPTAVIVVDVGCSMAAAGSDGKPLVQTAVDAIRRDLAGRAAAPALIAAGAQPLVMCEADLPTAVFLRQLQGVTVSRDESDSTGALELAANLLTGRQDAGCTIEWYTDRASLPEGLPREIAAKVRLRRAGVSTQAVAITGVVFEPSEAHPSQGAMRVRLSGRCERAMTLNVAMGDRARPHTVAPFDGKIDVVIDDVAADGTSVEFDLQSAPGSPAQHVMRCRLPRLTATRYCIVGNIPKPLRAALAAVGTESKSPAGALVVAAEGVSIPEGGAGTLRLVSAGLGGEGGSGAWALRLADGADQIVPSLAAIEFEGSTAVATLSVGQNCNPLLVADKCVLAGITQTDTGPCLYFSSALVDQSADFPRHAAFPVLIERLVSEIMGRQAAGPVVSAKRFAMDPLWKPVGPQSAIFSVPESIVVFDRPLLSSSADTPGPALSPSSGSAHRSHWREWLLLAALCMLGVEGALLAKKRIV